jgi:hypothetical protein
MTTETTEICARLHADAQRMREYSIELEADFRRARRQAPWLGLISGVLFLASVYATAKWLVPLVSVCA